MEMTMSEKIELEIRKLPNNFERQYWWDSRFEKWHYLSKSLLVSCNAFIVLWRNEPVGFISYRTVFGPRPNVWAIHRLVVLPDYQGMGFGSKLIKWLGEKLAREGGMLTAKVGNYKLQKFFEADPMIKVCKVYEQKLTERLINECTHYETIPAGIDPLTYKYPFTIVISGIGRGSSQNNYSILNINCKKVGMRYNGYDYYNKPHNYVVIDGDYSIEAYESLIDKYAKKDHYNFFSLGSPDVVKDISPFLIKRGYRHSNINIDPSSQVSVVHFTDKVVYVHPDGYEVHRKGIEKYIKEEHIENDGHISMDLF